MKYNKLTRRMFLEGAGKTALAIPFLPSLLPSTAQAAASPTRFITMQSDYFIAREIATPLYSKPNAAAWTQVDADNKYQLLSDIIKSEGQISEVFGKAWNSYANKMNIVSNSNAYMMSFLHNMTMASSACSVSGGDFSDPLYKYSTDFLAEKALYKNSPTPALGAARFNLWGTNNQYFNSWGTIDGKGVGLESAKNLTQLATTLSSNNVSQADPKVLRRKKLIDSVLPELNRLKSNARLSSVDKTRLTEAADRWNDIQNRAGSSLQCSFPNKTQGEDWDQNHRQAMDLMMMALSCNMTRVISYTLLQGGKENPQGLHNFAHDARNRNFNDVMKWRSNQVATFVGLLNSTMDENGAPLLDSSLLTWTHEYSSWGHQKFGFVSLTAGGANGRVKNGLHLDVGGTPHNNFFLTNLLALGLTLSDIERDGRAGYGEYATSISYQDGRADDKQDLATYGESDTDYWGGQYGKIDRQYKPATNFTRFFTDEAKRKPLFYLKG